MTKEERFLLSTIEMFPIRISRRERKEINKKFRTKFRSNRKALVFLERKIIEFDPWTGRIDRFKQFGSIVARGTICARNKHERSIRKGRMAHN